MVQNGFEMVKNWRPEKCPINFENCSVYSTVFFFLSGEITTSVDEGKSEKIAVFSVHNIGKCFQFLIREGIISSLFYASLPPTGTLRYCKNLLQNTKSHILMRLAGLSARRTVLEKLG